MAAAAFEFLEAGRRSALITSIGALARALGGRAGTLLTRRGRG